jgi:hypothetical protein
MTKLGKFAGRAMRAVGFLLTTVFFSTVSATPVWSSAIYEFHDLGTSAVIGTFTIATPPASTTTGWSTTDPADLLALHLDDSLFHLGTGDLLSTGTATSVAIFSFDGSNLDVGSIFVSFPTITPIDPLDPTIDRFLSILFFVDGGTDFINLATISTFPGGRVVTDDLFRFGDATVPVPEPGTVALLVIGLAAAGRNARRKRR